jgi:hypothetical protein|tara:strand:- start:191 stop:658 length:468 start_codon:yes stop_codon:yes gene_type:complete
MLVCVVGIISITPIHFNWSIIMANIQLQRGQQQQVDVTYKLAGETDAANFSAAGAYDAEIVIRKKRGDNYMGQIIDVLRHGATSPASSEADSRILFNYVSASGPNIQLKWSTAEASFLPNEEITVYGDLKIIQVSSGETIHHVRLAFDILPEITP